MSENASTSFNLRMTVYCALFTALIIIGGYISIPVPIGPVPIVLADFFVMTAGLFLGWKYGLVSTLLYICLGTLGLPVFAGGKAGLAVLFGPTGGFLIGYPCMAALIGFFTDKCFDKTKISVITNVLALTAGNVLLYAIGVPRLKTVMHLSWPAAFTAGLVPFIPGIIIKIVSAAALCRVFLPRFRKQALLSVCASQTSDDDETGDE